MGVSARDLVVKRGSFVLDVPQFASGPGGIAILGPNGSGKTTLLLALQGLIPADGTVERPRRAAAVFARPAVLRGATLWNVAVVAECVRRLDARDANRRAKQILDDVGLMGRSATDARDLSTGERQRLALARAIACEPEALFLDEPFANVDADARPVLRSLVASYRRDCNCDIIVATAFWQTRWCFVPTYCF